VLIEPYIEAPAACLEYDPLAPEVARLISELILSESVALSDTSENARSGHSQFQTSPTMPEGVASELNRQARPDLRVEHIGSTSVPGCAGKGVIDLMLLYGEGGLEHAKRVLDWLGFQRQSTRDPFPESRPMRLGAINYQGKIYRTHVHVIPATSPEAAELQGFRDHLRADPELMKAYVDRKRAIVDAGIVDTVDYCEAKGEFIVGTTKR